MSLYKKAFSAGDDHAFFLDQKVLSFSPVAPSVLAIFSKLHEFLQNSISSRMSGGFNIFALRTTFKRFSAKCTSLSKTAFSALDQHVLSFLHCVHHFLTLFAKCTRFFKEQNSVIRPRSERFIILALCPPLISDFHESARVCTNSVFSPRSACFVIFTLGTPLASVFSKVHDFLQNSVFSPRSARFNIFALGGALLSNF